MSYGATCTCIGVLALIIALAMGYYHTHHKVHDDDLPATRNPGIRDFTEYHSQSQLTKYEEDLINDPKSRGIKVVELCVKKLKSDTFGMLDDNDFMRRIAYVMSDFGNNIKRNGGIWQVPYDAYTDTMDTTAHKRLPRKYTRIMEAYGIDWKKVKYKDLDKPFYSALAARLYLSNFADLIPPANQIMDQANYWKMYYLSGIGAANVFAEKVKELEQTHPYSP